MARASASEMIGILLPGVKLPNLSGLTSAIAQTSLSVMPQNCSTTLPFVEAPYPMTRLPSETSVCKPGLSGSSQLDYCQTTRQLPNLRYAHVNDQRTVLVTGSDGFIGRHLVPYLAARGY